jgi:hypothetical protein
MPIAAKIKITATEQAKQLAELEQRRRDNKGKQIDNGRLPAGSAMHYYCRLCGAPTISIAESDFMTRIPRHCDKCKVMIDCGYSPDLGRFLELAD